MQHRLTTEFVQSKADQLIETDSNRDAARLRSIRGKGAGAWLDSIPSSEKFALSSGNFVLAASLRLGLPLSLPPWATKCECGKSLDVEGYHLLTCKMGGGPVWSHNSVVLCWSECMSSLQCQHQIEPKDRYTTSNNRADIVVFDSTCGEMSSLMWPLLTPGARTFCEVQQLQMELQQEEEKTSNIANILKSSCLEGTLLPLFH